MPFGDVGLHDSSNLSCMVRRIDHPEVGWKLIGSIDVLALGYFGCSHVYGRSETLPLAGDAQVPQSTGSLDPTANPDAYLF